MTRDEEDALLADASQGVLALRQAAAAGLLLNNLFQSDDGRFHAAFKRPAGGRYVYYKYAEGRTSSAALHAALALATDTQPSPDEGSVLD